MEKVRQIKLFKNYYKEFYVAQTQTVRDKINFMLRMIETQRIIPKKFFRILEGQKTPPKEIKRANRSSETLSRSKSRFEPFSLKV